MHPNILLIVVALLFGFSGWWSSGLPALTMPLGFLFLCSITSGQWTWLNVLATVFMYLVWGVSSVPVMIGLLLNLVHPSRIIMMIAGSVGGMGIVFVASINSPKLGHAVHILRAGVLGGLTAIPITDSLAIAPNDAVAQAHLAAAKAGFALWQAAIGGYLFYAQRPNLVAAKLR